MVSKKEEHKSVIRQKTKPNLASYLRRGNSISHPEETGTTKRKLKFPYFLRKRKVFVGKVFVGLFYRANLRRKLLKIGEYWYRPSFK